MLAATGCRRGEACALRWTDVDLERAEVAVRRPISQVNGELRPAKSVASHTVFRNHRSVAVTVRRIQPTDAERLRRVRLAALADAPSAFGSTYEREAAFTEGEWTERAQAGSTGLLRSTFLAEDGQEVVGVVGGYRLADDDPTVELVSMWVAPTHRRQHLGRALVERVCDWASETDGRAVALWVTRGNVPAEALYRELGFRETGDVQPLPSDPCEDELRLEHALG